MTPRTAPPSPVYLGPARWHGAADNKPIVRIVVHCTAGAEPGVPGAARSTASYTKNTDRPSSWHYCADARESVQLVYDSVVAYHCGYNGHSIGYELCCSLSGEGDGHWLEQVARKAKVAAHFRLKGDHRAMLKIAAADIARLCLAYGVPIRRLSVAQVRAGEHGICGHVDIRDAFPGVTTHWDPGPFFPWWRFMRHIRREAKKLTAPAPPRGTR